MSGKRERKKKEETAAVRVLKISAVVIGAYLYSQVLTGLIDISSRSNISADFEAAADAVNMPEARPLIALEEAPRLSYDAFGNMYQKKYLNKETDILKDTQILSSSVEKGDKRESVFVVSQENDYSEIMTNEGNVGYVRTSALTDNLEYIFDEADMTKYAKANTFVRRAPFIDGEEAGKLSLNTKLVIKGTNDMQFWQTEYKGETVYVDKDDLMDKPKVIAPVQPKSSGGGYIGTWDGRKLTRSNGTIMGPSGKETYYNLRMNYVVELMHDAGFQGEYWVRSDGVKMFGDYVMVAADFSIRPKGTILPTSLGMGIVCDTGTFIYTNRYQIDIAVNW
ncbi:MAG TPA: hypothetical protein DHW39_01655 [Erysipelotrichaceae bacterium]|nr:hypothetical protein [Erysipelotrichaceae bacterium]